jgi:hypothetical protein
MIDELLLLGQRVAHRGERHRAGGECDGRGMSFQQGAELHQLLDLPPGQRRHVRSAFGHHLDQALGDEQQQGFAHRCARHADGLGEPYLVEEGSLHCRIDQHRLPQVAVGALAPRPEGRRRGLHAVCIH